MSAPLGKLIDAAVLAGHRLRHCRCLDCSHDVEAIDAETDVRGYMIENLGLTLDQLDALGRLLS